jgi:hypothetical protein
VSITIPADVTLSDCPSCSSLIRIQQQTAQKYAASQQQPVAKQQEAVVPQPQAVVQQPQITQQQQAAPQQQFGKPKVAVYVSEHSEDKSKLRLFALTTLVESGRYNVIERSDVMDAELSRQASGDVDDDQVVAFGRWAGAQYVCIVDKILLFNWSDPHGQSYKIYQLSARLIDVETAEVLGLGTVTTDEWGRGAYEVPINKMLTTIQPPNVANKAKMAVYVTGNRKGQREGNALYSYMLEALFTRSRILGTFKVVERSEAFTKQIDRELTMQHSGRVDDSQIMRLGKQYGIEKILVVNMEHTSNKYNDSKSIREILGAKEENISNYYYISARIINVETAEVETISSIRTEEGSDLRIGGGGQAKYYVLSQLGRISNEIVEEMMGITSTEKKQRKRKMILDAVVGIPILVGIAALCIWAVTTSR